MKNRALHQFIEQVSAIWGPLNSALTKHCKHLLETLIKDGKNEDWVKQLLLDKAPVSELYRSEEHGFLLQAHVENAGEYSPPHDHGNGWVLYATVQGEVEMGIFHPVLTPQGQLNLVQKDKYVQRSGQCNVYLQGDIHDTKSLQDNTLMLRLTSCDFYQEFKQGRLIRYINNSEKW